MYPIPASEKLVETKKCLHCHGEFPITDKDLEFYDMLSPVFSGRKYVIPTPKLCPDCRRQRRLSHRNERKLYTRTCDATGKNIVSIYSPESKAKVYGRDYWWSDAWNPLDYGRDFDFTRSFFEQFQELRLAVPRVQLFNTNAENSEYLNHAKDNKNSYMSMPCFSSENVLYSFESFNNVDCVDTYFCKHSEACYEGFFGIHCSYCKYFINCESCYNCSYIVSCIGCKNCFMCNNLQNKEYYIDNISYSKEEYEHKLSQYLALGSQALMGRFVKMRSSMIHKYILSIGSEDSVGDCLINCKNCNYSYELNGMEDAKYCLLGNSCTKAYDACGFGSLVAPVEHVYEAHGAIGSRILFSNLVYGVSDVMYCDHCYNISNCFGCVGLHANVSYCVFNKQYPKEQYELLVPKIIEHMKAMGEWGEFVPSKYSLFGYNETVADMYAPLTREQVVSSSGATAKDLGNSNNSSSLGFSLRSEGCTVDSNAFLHGPIFNWSDYEAPFPKVEKVIPASKLPDDIKKIPDDILNWAIECELTHRPFRIIKQELEFYRKHNLPIPKRHPDQRHKDRFNLKNPSELHEHHCQHCQKSILTTFSNNRSGEVYCEQCYEQYALQ